MEETAVIKAMAALAQTTRLRVFRALVIAGREGLTPSAMADGLQISATALSFHLKELANASLVSQERVGRYLVYRADYAQMNGLLGYLTENCCTGAACAVEPARATCAR